MGEMSGFGSAKTAIMHVLDDTGDTKIMWNPRDKDEVKNAKKNFARLVEQGFRAFSVKKTGEKGERLTEFDPASEKIIFVPQLAGG